MFAQSRRLDPAGFDGDLRPGTTTSFQKERAFSLIGLNQAYWPVTYNRSDKARYSSAGTQIGNQTGMGGKHLTYRNAVINVTGPDVWSVPGRDEVDGLVPSEQAIHVNTQALMRFT